MVDSYGSTPVISEKRGPSLLVVSFVGGVLGAIAMTIVSALWRLAILSGVNIELLLGSLVTGRMDSGSWVVGFLWHMLNGGLFALAYAGIFRWLRYSGTFAGGELSILHWLAGGVLFGIASAINPFIPALMPPPGFFAANLGPLPAIEFFLLHVIFGLVVGAVYHSAIRQRLTERQDSDEYFEKAA